MEEKETKAAQVPALVEFDASVRAMMPRNFEGLWRMATIMAKSGMMPRGIEQPETVFVAVQMGLEVGLPPMAAVQNIAVINGRPSIWGDAVLGLVRASGLLESFKESFNGTFPGDDYTAVCTALRRGDPEPIEREFSVADAKRAGLWQTEARVTRRRKDGGTYETDNDVPWFKYPKRMLQMRARSWALRDGFGDVLRGLQVREEMRDVTPMERVADGVYEAKEDGPPLSEKIKGLKTDKPAATGISGKKPDHVAIDDMKPENPTQAYDPGPDSSGSEKKPPATLTVSPGAEDATDGFFLAEFINLRTAGYSTYIHKNKERLRDAPENVKAAAREKWEKFYPEAPWPIGDDSPDRDNVVLEGLEDDWRSCHSIDATIANQIISECGELETEDDYRGALKLFETMLDQKNG
ncbi:MAG: hypothetical protein ABIJ57_12345, partial [Pseudomonadota bacterium]